MTLALRNVLVTGASRGLGLAIARRLAADGYRVLGTARRSSDGLSEAATHARAQGAGAIEFTPFDLDRIEDIPALVKDLRSSHGPLFGLVNNAGLGTEGLLATMRVDEIERLVRLNTLAPVVLAKHAVRSMMSGKGGRIVNMASIVAEAGFSGLSVYAATKASMIGFTRSLAREVGPLGITVNAVAPGFVATDMTAGLGEHGTERVARRAALKRLATADEVAHAVSYLVGDGASGVTGTVLTVDAGGTA